MQIWQHATGTSQMDEATAAVVRLQINSISILEESRCDGIVSDTAPHHGQLLHRKGGWGMAQRQIQQAVLLSLLMVDGKLQMGHATAEAVVRAGLQLIPISFTGASEAVAVGNVGVSGIPVELIGPEERQMAMQRVKDQYPGMVLIDFTLPSVVNGERSPRQCIMGEALLCTSTSGLMGACMWGADNVEFYAHNSIPFVVGTTGRGSREAAA